MSGRSKKTRKVSHVDLRSSPSRGSSASPRRSRASPLKEHCLVQDSQAYEDALSPRDNCPRPFKGAVIAATGIKNKAQLFEKARELGATCISDFTDRVTHLIASSHGGAKYACAVTRKVPILLPSWINDSYVVWARGDDVELEPSAEAHRLPIFAGVILCPSGIEDVSVRTKINRLVTQHGGTYVKELVRPVRVTHLLCGGNGETSKMKYAKKFNERKEANIHLVWDEWFWDSLEFGGRFPEETYQVERPRPDRKSILPTYSSPPPISTIMTKEPSVLVRETASPVAHPQPSPFDIASQAADINRAPGTAVKLWASLLKPRGCQMTSSGKRILREQAPPLDAFDGGKENRVLPLSQRAQSFIFPKNPDLHTPPPPPPESNKQRVPSPLSNVRPDPKLTLKIVDVQPEAGPSRLDTTGIFAGLKFRALGEARSTKVRSAIKEAGGSWLPPEAKEEDADFTVVRLASGNYLYRAQEDAALRRRWRTECWLEQCLHENRIVDPETHISFVPVSVQLPLAGAEKIRISFSGLEQSETFFIGRLVRALGIQHLESFSKQSTHLLCPPGKGSKFDMARKWGIPVVDMRWIEDIKNTGIVPGNSTISPVCVDPKPEQACAVPPIEAKGKRKAKATDNACPEPIARFPAMPRFDGLPPHASPCKLFVSSFGRPNLLLGPTKHPPSYGHQGRTSTPAPLVQCSSDSALLRPPSRPRSPPIYPLSNPLLQTPPRAKTQGAEMDLGRSPRIPSSASPSPLRSLGRDYTAPVSPLKGTPVSAEATKNLHDNIDVLLGKRKSFDDAAGSSKRQRPQRMKSRHSSFTRGEREPIEEMCLPVFEPCQFNGQDDEEVGQESIRVLYDDPAQRAEQKRLMNMFESQEEESQPMKKPPAPRPRKKARVGGF